jgi:DNA-binding MarR family transcriptional regulator
MPGLRRQCTSAAQYGLNRRFTPLAMIVESLRGIEAFVRTVDAGSFSAAARQLGVSPVAVSRNVARLERNLGVQLLQRTTHTLSLTDEGRLPASCA